ncbi:MAG: hypothetical protein H6589_02130 [Flavobacteriales bacterium]|nr:hypothetical protein [Flavobacteriales bacterium]
MFKIFKKDNTKINSKIEILNEKEASKIIGGSATDRTFGDGHETNQNLATTRTFGDGHQADQNSGGIL